MSDKNASFDITLSREKRKCLQEYKVGNGCTWKTLRKG